jgi:hypothetical protein
MKHKLELLPRRNGSNLSQTLVRNADTNEILGLIEKFDNTRTEKHPYKAFFGIGANIEYIGAYFPSCGGKAAAIRAIKYFNTSSTLPL